MFDEKTRTANRDELKACFKSAKEWNEEIEQWIFTQDRLDDAHGYEWDETLSRHEPDMEYRVKHEFEFISEIEVAWEELLRINDITIRDEEARRVLRGLCP